MRSEEDQELSREFLLGNLGKDLGLGFALAGQSPVVGMLYLKGEEL